MLVRVALAFAVGTALGLRLDGTGSLLPWVCAGCLAVSALVVRPRQWRRSVLLVAVCAAGVFLSRPPQAFPTWLILRAGAIEEVTGTVISYPSIGEDHVAFDFAPDTLPGDLRVTWFAIREASIHVRYGDRLTLTGAVRLPEAFDGFDYPAYLARQGIFASMIVEGDAGRAHEDVGGAALFRLGDRLRQGLLLRIREGFGAAAAGLAQGILLGDRAALSDEVEDAFRTTGLMHVLAVSGLHLGIVLAGAWFILRRLGVRPRTAYPVVGAIVLLILWIVGPRVSLVRASLLFGFLALGSVLADLGWILRRTIDPLNGLAAAALVLLAIDPGQLLDSGFQLSFAATGGILIAVSPGFRSQWEPAIDRVAASMGRMRRVVRPILGSLVISTAAQAAVAPVVAWHFGTFHPLLILFNLVVVPLVTVALAVGVPGVLLLGLGVPGFVAIPFGISLHALSRTVSTLARFPFAELPMSRGLGVWMAGMVVFAAVAWRYSDVSS